MSLLPADTLGTQQVYDTVRLGERLYQGPYSMTAAAQERLVMEVRRSGARVKVFQASQQASRMAS